MKKTFRYLFILIALFLTTCQAETTTTPLPANPQADKLQEIISKLEQETLKVNRWELNPYFRTIEYAARDALKNFPNDPRAESWKWKLAYYAILAGDTQLGNETYADLIETALNNGDASIDSLPTWFHAGELPNPDQISAIELTTEKIVTAEENNKYLIKLSTFPGGSCFLINQNLQTYSADLIYDGFPKGGYSYVYDSLGCTLKDLTNDGNDEVILGHYIGAHVGFTYLRVMDISVDPIHLLPFKSPIGESTFVQVNESVNDFPFQNGKNLMRTSDYAQNCQVSLEKTYEWNGTEFEPLDMQFHADVKEYAPLKECLSWSIAYARWEEVDFGVETIDQAITQYEKVAVDEIDKEKLDEIRIEKALLYLFADRPTESIAVLQAVVENPYQENGVWVESAEKFLQVYQDPPDIYLACRQLIACVKDESGACSFRNLCEQRVLKYMTQNQLHNIPLEKLVDKLETLGVDIASTGYFDLDNDGTNELWFFIASPNKAENLVNELWIASGYPDGISLFYVYPAMDGQEASTEFQIAMTITGETFIKRSGYLSFLWSRELLTNEPKFQVQSCPVIDCYEDMHDNDFTSFIELRHQLHSGSDIYEMYVKYMNLMKKYDSMLNKDCPVCEFDLAYIAELVGDHKKSNEMYSKLIEKFPEHPLAILAKNKLEN